VGLPGERFLLATDITAGCIDFIVALSLEVVETFLKFGKGRDAASGGFLY
jgi:hypothetical protein